uniref:Importin N-terminal domain-containing protein n=1 Tax=Glossina brevipalpis TaxID=37001 RepID=A0A1A9WBG3_9MUSC
MAVNILDDGLLKQSILEELDNLLSPDMDIRNAAEESMKHLEYVESYGVILTEIILNQIAQLRLRQMAGIMLTRYVERYWDEHNTVNDLCEASGGGPVITIRAKCTIRDTLPVGLRDCNIIIRSSIANTICTIADTDYPNDWTDLSDVIVQCLNGDDHSIHGIMEVLINFQYDRRQIAVLGSLIISNAYRVFELEEVYSIQTRSLAVRVLKPIFLAASSLEKKERASIIHFALNTYLEKMIYYLSLNNDPNSYFTLHIEIIKVVLTFVVTEMTNYLEAYVDRLLPVMLQLFTKFADMYIKVVVNVTIPNPATNENEFLKLILQCLEFIHHTISSGKFRSVFKMALNDLVYPSILYIQLPQQQLEQWEVDPEKYFQDEENVEVTVRILGQDILWALMESVGPELLPPLQAAVNRLMIVAEAENLTGNVNWWKIQEACFVAVHNLHDLLFNYEEQFDLSNYLTAIRSYLNDHDYPYMAGRALWTLGTWAGSKFINYEILGEILTKIQHILEVEKNFCLKINAVRAFYSIAEAHDILDNDKRELVGSKFGCVADGITVLISDCSSLALCVLLDCLNGIMKANPLVAVTAKSKFVSLAFEVFKKYPDNPFIFHSTRDLIRALCANKLCLRLVRKKFLSSIINILSLGEEDPNNVIKKNCAVDVLSIITQNSKGSLSGDLLTKAFPAMIKFVLHSKSNDTVVAGEKCLRAYLSVSSKEICAYNNGEGLQYVMEFMTMILTLSINKATTIKFGPTAIAVIKNMGIMLDDCICALLRVFIIEMQNISDVNVLIDIVMVFAYLFLTQRQDLFNFLAPLSNLTSGSSLKLVFGTWLSVQKSVDGVYERRLTTMALCKLLEYGLAEQDYRFISLKVADHDIDKNAPMTPHMAAYLYGNDSPYVYIPVLVKIYKLLIKELCCLMESSLDLDCDTDTDASVNSSEDSLPGNYFTKKSNVKQSSDYSECVTVTDDQLIQELLMDPLLQNDMLGYITNIVKSLSVSEHYRSFANYFTDFEKDILKTITLPSQ